METHDKRLTELEERQEAAQLKLNKLDMHMEARGEFLDKKHFVCEIKVILRDLTYIKIRIRHLQISKKEVVDEEEFKTMED